MGTLTSSVCMFSHVWLFATPWIVACQAPLSTEFSRQEYWSGLPSPPGDLPNLEIESASLTSLALAGRFFTTDHLQASFGHPDTPQCHLLPCYTKNLDYTCIFSTNPQIYIRFSPPSPLSHSFTLSFLGWLVQCQAAHRKCSINFGNCHYCCCY